MQNLWLLFTLSAMLLYGLWGFFAKMATQSLKDIDAAIYQSIGYILVAGLAAIFYGFQTEIKSIGIFYAVLSGVCVGLAAFFFFGAITRGRTVVIVSITALYPLVTLGLSALFLQEALTLRHLLGVGLALGAIILLSS